VVRARISTQLKVTEPSPLSLVRSIAKDENMKCLLILLASIFFAATSYAKEIERLQYDFDGDGSQDTIVLNIEDDWDVGVFTNISVSLSNGTNHSFENLNAWDVVSEGVGLDLLSWFQSNNLVPSDNVVLIRETDNSHLLFAFGYAYGSSPGELSIFRLDNNGMSTIFNDNFWPSKIIVQDNKRTIEMIGDRCFSQVWGLNNQCTTYSPFNVITLGDTALLNEEKTKEYNLLHYYGYAGPNCSEKIAIYEENGRKTLLDEESTIKRCRP